jgi:SMI1 / KNR4 family (SUKH-1)
METYREIIQRLSAQTGVDFGPASAADVEALAGLGVPESILTFYRSYEPRECAEDQIRLWPIAHIIEENSNFIPGCYTAPHGYIVFATTHTGDAYCFDLKSQTKSGTPSIVLIPHDVIDETTPVERMKHLAKLIAPDLHEFLELFASKQVDEQCIYE